ncbi:hypothetical protein Pfo_015937 [Paulownia fortunei]|nr:hypothetical protein Pfo_015937 [Paulownia fortunei]
MEYRTLEITLHYANDLNKVNLIWKMDVYVVVSISGGDKSSKQKTKTQFTVEEEALQQNRLVLDFKLVCQRALGDRDIGEVHVPIKELLDSQAKGAAEGKKFVSYQVTKPSGKPKGQLTFSYQFSEKNTSCAAPPPVVKAYGEPVTAYPVVGPSSVYPPVAPEVYPPPPSYSVTAAAERGGGYYPPPAVYSPAGGPTPGGYPPPPWYGYPTPPPGYGYPPPPGYGYPPQPGYGYPPSLEQQAPKKNKFGMGLGTGLLVGAIGGLLIGDDF